MIHRRKGDGSYRHSKLILYALLGLVSVGLPDANVARAEEQDRACKHKGVTVLNNSPNELTMVCRAMNDIVAYFKSIGFSPKLKATLTFADRAGDRGFSHGYFDANESRIVVYRSSNASPWGRPWTSRMAASFLRHELVHLAIWEILGEVPTRLKQEWHEFVAYAIQFDLMDPKLRSSVLASMGHIRPFETFLEINEFVARMKPGQFAVAVYKMYRAKGGRKFVQQLLLGKIVPTPFSYPFPVLPAQ